MCRSRYEDRSDDYPCWKRTLFRAKRHRSRALIGWPRTDAENFFLINEVWKQTRSEASTYRSSVPLSVLLNSMHVCSLNLICVIQHSRIQPSSQCNSLLEHIVIILCRANYPIYRFEWGTTERHQLSSFSSPSFLVFGKHRERNSIITRP